MYAIGLNQKAIKQTTGIQNLDTDNYFNEYFYTPSFEEQKDISEFLDRKTAQIDDLIAKKERMIELLKEERTAIINQAVIKGLDPKAEMKDSGIKWLGKVPKHWKIKKLKYLSIGGLKNGLFKKTEEFGDGTKLINVTNLYKDDFLIDDSELDRVDVAPQEFEIYRVQEGDIFFVRSSLKKEGIATSACVETVKEPLVFECHLIKISPEKNLIVPFFLVNYLNSSVIRDRLVSLSITTTMTTISQVGLGTLEILAPPIDEQKLIIQKLKDMNDNFFSTVSKIQLEIDLLKEYRTALISEVVTGKIDVRNQ